MRDSALRAKYPVRDGSLPARKDPLGWEIPHPLVGYFPEQDQIRLDDPEEDEDELDESTDQLCNQLGITGVHPFVEDALKARLKRRLARSDADERIRLLTYLR